MTNLTPTFNKRAAITRSMLGWGVVAGPVYLIGAVVHAILRPEFDFTEHALSLLMLTDTGWLHRACLILVGIMVLVAAWGFGRIVEGGTRVPWVAALVAGYGVSLLGSGSFAPDPVDGFPPGTEAAASWSGIVHLAFGALGFLCLSVGALVFARWCRARGCSRGAHLSIVAGIVVILGFIGGAVFATMGAGVILLWVAVVAGFVWLMGASVYAYRTVPHPDGDGTA
ncbi:DUF998 domain-containing protein [Nesterenkonia muleiensis]|uniref:DUF998 domain-containing protein n=1 Tax=Nesterenkonia muleiensis TaxID=2282648 RepID=UPI000E72516B|nr:DUF998 domain-containing protein [Nesterenkonia muleiensis]